MKTRQLLVLGVLFALVLSVISSTEQVETSKSENDKSPEGYHVNNGYGGGGSWGGYGGGGGWDGYGGGGWGGPGGGGGWGGYSGGGWGGPGGGGGWGGPGGGGGWGGRGGYGGGGWGGPGGSGGWGGGGGGWRGGGWRRGCRYGCCGIWYRHGGCSHCCRSLTEAIAFNEHETTP